MKYILMFFTFLSVCNASDFLTIPLVLDDTREVTVPAGATTIDQTYTINVDNDADFEKYLNTIKSYDITGITLIAESYTGPSTIFNGTIDFGNAYAKITDWDLKDPTPLVASLTASDLVYIGQRFQQYGSENVTMKGSLSNNKGGTLKLHIKVNLKIKV